MLDVGLFKEWIATGRVIRGPSLKRSERDERDEYLKNVFTQNREFYTPINADTFSQPLTIGRHICYVHSAAACNRTLCKSA